MALTYFARRVPETKGRSLQEIERDLSMPTGGATGGGTSTAPAAT